MNLFIPKFSPNQFGNFKKHSPEPDVHQGSKSCFCQGIAFEKFI